MDLTQQRNQERISASESETKRESFGTSSFFGYPNHLWLYKSFPPSPNPNEEAIERSIWVVPP